MSPVLVEKAIYKDNNVSRWKIQLHRMNFMMVFSYPSNLRYTLMYSIFICPFEILFCLEYELESL